MSAERREKRTRHSVDLAISLSQAPKPTSSKFHEPTQEARKKRRKTYAGRDLTENPQGIQAEKVLTTSEQKSIPRKETRACKNKVPIRLEEPALESLSSSTNSKIFKNIRAVSTNSHKHNTKIKVSMSTESGEDELNVTLETNTARIKGKSRAKFVKVEMKLDEEEGREAYSSTIPAGLIEESSLKINIRKLNRMTKPNLMDSSYKNTNTRGNDIHDDPRLLPTVVWVKEKEGAGWWPAEIISEDKSQFPLLVKKFGRIIPNIIEVPVTSSEWILPFNHELAPDFRAAGEISDLQGLFAKAMELALEKDAQENDGLPDEDWAIQKVPTTPIVTKLKKPVTSKISNNRGDRSASPISPVKIDQHDKDSNFFDRGLKIPGELVLVRSTLHRRIVKYYPGRIEAFIEPDKYEIEYCDKSHKICGRKDFFTSMDSEFTTCELGEWEQEKEDPNYDDPSVRERVQQLRPILERVAIGKEQLSWRYNDFVEGGKSRRLLAENVGRGPFDLNEFGLIFRILRAMFVPEVTQSIVKASAPTHNRFKRKRPLPASYNSHPSIILSSNEPGIPFLSYSSDLKLRFVNDVLIPETIIRLIMDQEHVSYKDADALMLNGYEEVGWVDRIMAIRNSFLSGKESLDMSRRLKAILFYGALCFFRLWSSLSYGYVHPDEFFQSPEIMAGDILGCEVYRPWEFNELTPSRSIVVPALTTGLPLYFLKTYNEWQKGVLGRDDIIDSSMVFTIVRLTFFFLSFIIDFSTYQIASLHQEQQCDKEGKSNDAFQALFLVASSYVVLIFHTRPFSNAVESMILSLCFYIYLKGTLVTDLNDKKMENEGTIQKNGTSFPLNLAFTLGCLAALGIFTRITFILFSIPIGIAFLFRSLFAPGNELKSGVHEKLKEVTPVGISFFLTSGICIILDSIYFGTLKIFFAGQRFRINHLFDIMREPKRLFDLHWSGKLVIAPLNNILYNLNTSNLAEHGLHPRYVHFINYALLFGPMIYFNLMDIYGFLKRFQSSFLFDCKDYHLLAVLTFSGICGFTLLSVMPHQEARFLLPMLLPVVLNTSLQKKLSRRFWSVWIFFNLFALIFYGVFHQSGIVPMLGKLQYQKMGFKNCIEIGYRHMGCELVEQMKSEFNTGNVFHTNIIFYKTFMPPRHLLLYPKPNRATKNQITIHDLAGAPKEEVEKLLRSRLAVKNIHIDRYPWRRWAVFKEREDVARVYERTILVTPSTSVLPTSKELSLPLTSNTTKFIDLQLIDWQWPHLNTDHFDRVLSHGLYLNGTHNLKSCKANEMFKIHSQKSPAFKSTDDSPIYDSLLDFHSRSYLENTPLICYSLKLEGPRG
ncbi:hypothetical protein G9A89_021990 [Geosiphon pyriformis]|nr:hypothetical protein G9A89_021990 [Geosiphon pyriformis]